MFLREVLHLLMSFFVYSGHDYSSVALEYCLLQLRETRCLIKCNGTSIGGGGGANIGEGGEIANCWPHTFAAGAD